MKLTKLFKNAREVLFFAKIWSRNIFFSARGLRAAADWSKLGGADLSGKVVGIIGAGYIGKEVIRMLQPFGCKILVNDILDQSD